MMSSWRGNGGFMLEQPGENRNGVRRAADWVEARPRSGGDSDHDDLNHVEHLLAEAKHITKRLKTERKKDKEQIKFVNKVNKNLEERVQLLKEQQTDLHIETQKKAPAISEDFLIMSRKQINLFFNMGTVACNWAGEEEERLEIKVDQNFCLQRFLDSYYRKHEKLQATKYPKDGVSMDASLLFGDLHHKKGAKLFRNYHGKKFLSDWNIIFRNEFKYSRTRSQREQRESDTVVDEGRNEGPTAEFLSQFFYQIGDVYVESKDHLQHPVKVNLFEKVSTGIIPQTDEWLNHKLRNSPELMDKVWAIYRAFGRVMLHALATGFTISSSVLPSFYKNWVFRGCSPEDDDYHNEDVVAHLHEENPVFNIAAYLGMPLDDSDSGRVVDEENVFTHFLPRVLLHSRQLGFGSIKEGLTLDGDVRVDDFLRTMPFEVVQKLIFSFPTISAEAINAILVPKFCVGWEGGNEEGNELRKKQEGCFDTLCEVLRNKEESQPCFLAKFIAFCTGLHYLPDPKGNPDFCIYVEFNSAERMPGSYPSAHTCVKLLVLPGHVYSTRDEFEQKLDESVLSSYGRFDMN